jgi:uroporphyrinogen decarboxylase
MACGHRERVQITLNHQAPDRVPLDMMGNATMLLDETYFRLRDHLGLPPIPPVRTGSTANYYDPRILERLDVDFRRVFLGRNPRSRPVTGADGSFTDPWGVRYKPQGWYVNIVDSPLRGTDTVARIEAHPWPRARDLFVTEGLAEEAELLYRTTDFALVARNPLTEGFFDRACQLMGTAEFLVALIETPEVAQSLLSHLLAVYRDVYAMFLDAVGPYVQVVETADDLGTQESLFISPSMYREFLKPLDKSLYALIHHKAPGAAVFRHVDGAIFELIPDLVQAGVDILNPTQTSARGMDAARLKAAYGRSPLIFHGAIEKASAPRSELIDEVKAKIDILGEGGGYILASCNHMIDVDPANIVAMFETAREYGRYR